jgi:hypothetical protein
MDGKNLQCFSSDLLSKPAIVAHDQEPLDLLYYDKKHIYQAFSKIFGSHEHELSDRPQAEVLQCLSRLHMRSILHPSLHPVVLLHSEKHSKQVRLHQQIGYITAYYWCHAVLSRDWFRYAKIDPQLAFDHNRIKKDFLVYSRAWTGTREYRLCFLEHLANSGLAGHCRASFSSHDHNTHYSEHRFKNPDLSLAGVDLESIFPQTQAETWASADYNNQDYAATAIDTVLETMFDDTRWHLTEKALRPIACGKPFILVSTPGSLQYLREYGFQTFDSLINEHYDQVHDPVERIRAVVTEMSRIAGLPSRHKQELYKEMHVVARRNQQHFFSDEFHDCVLQELKINVSQALDQAAADRSLTWAQQRETIAKLTMHRHWQEYQSLSML